MARGGGGGGDFYAVAHGRKVGVFPTWAVAEAHVKGFKGAVFKKFASHGDALAFLAANGASAHARSATSNNNSSRKHARSDEPQVATAAEQPAAKRTHLQQTLNAVAEGHNAGVVTSRPQVLALTNGHARPVSRKFDTRAAADAFVAGYASRDDCGGLPVTSRAPAEFTGKSYQIGYVVRANADTTDANQQQLQVEAGNQPIDTKAAAPTQFWSAVARGRRTGVFATWGEAKQHVEGLFGASFKKFPSREEAEAFVRQHEQSTRTGAGDPNPEHPDTLVAFCDGSALQNGQRGCRAGFACVFPHCTAWNVAKKLVEPRPTNNRAEYFAALEAMKRANVEDAAQRRVLFIFSDSNLLIRSMTEWIGTWRRNNWCKADGAPVLNRDILEQLAAEQGERRVVWRHVKAHTGRKDWRSKWNDVADRAARGAAGE